MKKRILIVEDNITLSQIVKDWLEREGYAVATAIDEPFARKLLRKESFDLILSDVRLPQGDGIHLLEWINKEKMDIPFVIMTEYASVTDAVKAIKMGAKDYLAKPVFHEQLVEMVKELLKPVSTVRSKEKELFKRTSPKAMEAMNMAELVAPSDISVLILGANGTGKESVARTIHFHSNRKDMPFVAVNCGAIPRELAASMFFGHTKGAFTGADTDKGGYFDAAKGGTLFLDEIGTFVSVRTCIIVWANLRYDSPHLLSVPKIYSRLPTSSARSSRQSFARLLKALLLKRNGCCSHIPGQVTSGSCRTRLDGRY